MPQARFVLIIMVIQILSLSFNLFDKISRLKLKTNVFLRNLPKRNDEAHSSSIPMTYSELLFEHDLSNQMDDQFINDLIRIKAVEIKRNDKHNAPRIEDVHFEFLDFSADTQFQNVLDSVDIHSECEDSIRFDSVIFTKSQQTVFNSAINKIGISFGMSTRMLSPSVYCQSFGEHQNLALFGFTASFPRSPLLHHILYQINDDLEHSEFVYYLSIMLTEPENLMIGMSDSSPFQHEAVRWYYRDNMTRNDVILFKRISERHFWTQRVPSFSVNRGKKQRIQTLLIPFLFSKHEWNIDAIRTTFTNVVEMWVLVAYWAMWMVLVFQPYLFGVNPA